MISKDCVYKLDCRIWKNCQLIESFVSFFKSRSERPWGEDHGVVLRVLDNEGVRSFGYFKFWVTGAVVTTREHMFFSGYVEVAVPGEQMNWHKIEKLNFLASRNEQDADELGRVVFSPEPISMFSHEIFEIKTAN